MSYGASKAALESVTFSAASELAPYGVTSNVVEPGPTDTGWMSPSLMAQIKNESALGHVTQPSEVAEVVLFLASEQARLITSQRLRLGRGRSARRKGSGLCMKHVNGWPSSKT